MEQRTHERFPSVVIIFCVIEEDYEMDITYLQMERNYISVQMERKRAYMEVRISEALYNCAVMWDLPCLLM